LRQESVCLTSHVAWAHAARGEGEEDGERQEEKGKEGEKSEVPTVWRARIKRCGLFLWRLLHFPIQFRGRSLDKKVYTNNQHLFSSTGARCLSITQSGL
jgi:hypothetical protein